MNLQDFSNSEAIPKAKAKFELIKLVQSAYSGEKAAANAYWGHSKSLFVTDKAEKLELTEIMNEELHHRNELLLILKSLDSSPNAFKEIVMNLIGYVIALLCLPGTWFMPMYGAGQLESKNIAEYEVLARLAFFSERMDLIPLFLDFAEKEWDHECYFRQKVLSHSFSKFIPLWKVPPEKESIRNDFEVFIRQNSSPQRSAL